MKKPMEKHAWKLVAVLLVCLLAVSMAACGGGTSSDTPAGDGGDASASAKDTLNVAVALDTGTLDPLLMTGKGGYLSVQRTYCEPLWDYDRETNERFWVLATAFDPVDGSDIHYTMKIREGVTFSNGNPLTAEDVLFTIKLNAADARAFLNVKAFDVEKTTVTDDYTLDVWYTAYDPSQEPGIVQMQIVDAESYDGAAYSENPVGTGPYAVTEYIVNTNVTVERRDDYWGEKPAIKTIYFKCLSELSQRVNALETGDVDFAQVSTDDIATIEDFGTTTTWVSNVGSSLIAQYNMKTLSLEARQAITYAIDRQAISDVAYNGQAELLEWGASKSLIETQDRYFNASEYYTDSPNLDKAKELATKAGLAGKTLTIVTNGDANYDTAAEVIQAALGELGAKASIIKKDQASYFDFLMSADVDAYDIAINTPVAPSNLPADIFGNYPTFIPQNWSGPEHDAYTKLAAETNATADLEAREDKVFELLKLHTENLLWFGLCEDPLVYAFSKDIKGTVYTVSGLTLFQTMTF